jgi:hypothetical protein
MANTMRKHRERSAMQNRFSNGGVEAKITDTINTGVHCYGQGPREDKNVFAQNQINRQSDVLL